MRRFTALIAAAAVAACSLTFLTPTAAQVARAPTNGRIEGIVLLAGSAAEPLANVEVWLLPQGTRGQSSSPAGTPTARTAATGRFVINNVLPGNYTLRIRRAGYFAPAHSATRDVITTPLTIAPQQQVRDLEFRLIQGGVLKGRVFDPEGKRVPGVAVSALQMAYTPEGHPRLSTVAISATPASMKTNDNGEYRLAWVPPGRYFVRAAYQPDGRLPMLGQTWVGQAAVGTYYPGSNDPRGAAAVLVPPGAEVTADIAARPPLTVNISGRFVLPGGNTGTVSREAVSISLFPRDPRTLTSLTPPGVSVLSNSAGRFALAHVPPGEYYLAARSRDSYAQVPIDVKDRNLEDVTIEVPAYVSMGMNVTIQSAGPGFGLDAIAGIGLRPEFSQMPLATTRIATDGTGQLTGLVPGRYVFQTLPLPGDSYVAVVRQGERSVLNEVISVGPNSPPLQVVINAAGGRIEGQVLDSKGKPVPATITLAPLAHRVSADASGRFALPNIPPGEYRVFAWESIPLGADANAAFMANFDFLGARVTIPPGGGTSQLDLRRIPADITW